MTHDDGEINIARIPVAGIAGLGMVGAAAVVAVALPPLRWVAIACLIGGTALGLTLIGARHRRARRESAIGGLILFLAVVVGAWIYLSR